MWIFLNDCYLSIVSKDCARDELMVRARRPGDIEKLFEVQVIKDAGTDYQYRARVKRDVIAQALVGELARVTYSNFKGSVADIPLHDAYLKVWGAMMTLQPKKPAAAFDHDRLFDFGDEPPPPPPPKKRKRKGKRNG